MKIILFSVLSISLISASTWQNIHSSVATHTTLNMQSGDLENSVMEFNIDGFKINLK